MKCILGDQFLYEVDLQLLEMALLLITLASLMPGQKCVHTKVGKEKHWTGKTHSNDSALQVGWP